MVSERHIKKISRNLQVSHISYGFCVEDAGGSHNNTKPTSSHNNFRINECLLEGDLLVAFIKGSNCQDLEIIYVGINLKYVVFFSNHFIKIVY